MFIERHTRYFLGWFIIGCDVKKGGSYSGASFRSSQYRSFEWAQLFENEAEYRSSRFAYRIMFHVENMQLL